MTILINVLIASIGLLHFWFLTLEMFLWQKPIGLKTFRNSPEMAKSTAVLAANQGLYNGFIGAGLIISLILTDGYTSSTFKIYFLSCVVVAGIFGARTVSKKIFFMQALPAMITLMLFFLTLNNVT